MQLRSLIRCGCTHGSPPAVVAHELARPDNAANNHKSQHLQHTVYGVDECTGSTHQHCEGWHPGWLHPGALSVEIDRVPQERQVGSRHDDDTDDDKEDHKGQVQHIVQPVQPNQRGQSERDLM